MTRLFATALGGGFELCLLEEHHAAQMFAAVDRNRAHLRRWLPWVDATRTEDDSLAFLRMSAQQFAEHRGFAVGIFHGREAAGVVGTHRIDWPNRRVEIGYWIAAEHQGRGLVTAACRLVITHLFAEVGLNRVEIRCAPGNTRSGAIPKRLGFRHEGTLRQAELLNGAYQDLDLWSMLREDWR